MERLKLRKDKQVWLLGTLIEELPVSRIPTNGDVLKYFFYLKDGPMKVEKHKHFNSAVAETVLIGVQQQWENAGIAAQRKDKVKAKILKLYEKYRDLQKNKDKKSNERKEQLFNDDMKKYFIIAHQNAPAMIQTDRFRSPKQKEEDMKFLEALVNDKKVLIGSKDKQYSKKIEKKVQRSERKRHSSESDHSNQHSKRQKTEASTSIDPLMQSDSEKSEEDEESTCHLPTEPTPKKKKSVQLELPRNPFQSPKITMMADRLNMSAGQRTAFMAAVATEGGANLKNLTLSKTSTRKAGKNIRKEGSRQIQADFCVPKHCTLHWDGKIIVGDSERLGILVAGSPDYTEGKLLGIPQIPDGTGKTQAQTSYALAQEWDLQSSIVGLGFDTTASNSGRKNGACVLLEELLEKKLFYLTCRHHVFERVLCAAWKSLFGKSSGPANEDFKDFKKSWDTLPSDFKTLKLPDRKLKCFKDEAVLFLQQKLSNPDSRDTLPRDDYRECAELMLILLGEIPPRGIHWLQPGAFHHARWMATVLYAAKMFAFGHHLGYSQDKMKKLHRICLFNALFYVKAWLSSSNGADAPSNDLQLWKTLNAFRKVDPELAAAVITAMERHFWYLTEEIVPFSLFSNQVTDAEKRKIAQMMIKVKDNTQFDRGVPTFPALKASSKLASLIGRNSWFLCSALNVKSEWLSKSPNSWMKDKDFLEVANFVHHVKVVNDLAERAIKLISDFATSITRDEDQRQYLLQAVEVHRRNIPDFQKRTLQNI